MRLNLQLTKVQVTIRGEAGGSFDIGVVAVIISGKQYPLPSEFAEVGPIIADDRKVVYSEVPWFDLQALEAGPSELIRHQLCWLASRGHPGFIVVNIR